MVYVSTACLKEKSISKILEVLADNNITNIELSGGTDYYDGLEYDLGMLKNKYNLNYACHAYFPPPKEHFVVNLASCNDIIYRKSINHYVDCIDMLKSLECNTLSVHAGFLVEVGTGEIGKRISNTVVYDKDRAYDRFCCAYEKLECLCHKNGIELYLENNVLSGENYKSFGYTNYMMMTDYESIMEMKGQMDFKLLLDLGHLHVSSKTLGLEYTKECSDLKKHVKWLHISENSGIFDEHKPLVRNSEIVREFAGIYESGINVTLETVGSINEILESVEIIGFQC
jgi:sugar phosphate isomerase/epimerase